MAHLKDRALEEGRLFANWDVYWDGFMTHGFIEKLRFFLVRRAYDRLLRSAKLNAGARFCELGAGTGVMSRYLGECYQADVTLVDNNPKALRFIQNHFADFKNRFHLVDRDVFDLKDLKGSFDLVHSGGLIEHFVGTARDKIIEAHCDLVKKNGYILILVPIINFWYRILNLGILKWLHLLDEIHEVPWSLTELSKTLHSKGFKVLSQSTVISEIGVLAQRIN